MDFESLTFRMDQMDRGTRRKIFDNDPVMMTTNNHHIKVEIQEANINILNIIY